MMSAMEGTTNARIDEIKRIVKDATGCRINQVEIIGFSENYIDYEIYADLEHDKRPVSTGRVII